MQNRANDGYDPTEIAKEFGRDPRTVMAHVGRRVSAEPKEQQGDEEVLPNHIKLGIPRGELVNRLLGYRILCFSGLLHNQMRLLKYCSFSAGDELTPYFGSTWRAMRYFRST